MDEEKEEEEEEEKEKANGEEEDEEEEIEENAEDIDVPLSEELEKSLGMFSPENQTTQRTLADLIMKALEDKQKQGGKQNERSGLNPKVVECYSQVAVYLKTYTSGKLPKAFKLIPSLHNWEEVLELTKPDTWSTQAMFVATRLFASNLPHKQIKKFYTFVLLPRVREDIASHKKLNYHLYASLKKGIFKPAAFFAGILFPLIENGCTPREAVIMASVLHKCSIPVLHSAVALLKLAKVRYSGPSTLFMKTLLNKKYSLPYRVIDSLVKYFNRFGKDERKMPVVWHQNLLTFVQRYKHDLTEEQKQNLKHLTKTQSHHQISREIQRELLAPPPINASTQSPKSVSRRGSVSMSGDFLV